METIKNLSTAASPWAAPSGAREQFGIAPDGSLQGTGLSAAGYPAAGLPTAGAPALPAMTAHSAQTLVVDRKVDSRVPEPRRQRR